MQSTSSLPSSILYSFSYSASTSGVGSKSGFDTKRKESEWGTTKDSNRTKYIVSKF
jgi:hypothetical protein